MEPGIFELMKLVSSASRVKSGTLVSLHQNDTARKIGRQAFSEHIKTADNCFFSRCLNTEFVPTSSPLDLFMALGNHKKYYKFCKKID